MEGVTQPNAETAPETVPEGVTQPATDSANGAEEQEPQEAQQPGNRQTT
jgi:hypothetical protein